MASLSIEEKEKILTNPVSVDGVMSLTGYSRKKCYQIMDICRKEYSGRAGRLTDRITPESICLYIGTTLENEMRYIGIAKGSYEERR